MRVKQALQDGGDGDREKQADEGQKPIAELKSLEEAAPEDVYNHFFIGSLYNVPEAVLEALAFQCKELAGIFMVRADNRPPVKSSGQDKRGQVTGTTKLVRAAAWIKRAFLFSSSFPPPPSCHLNARTI